MTRGGAPVDYAKLTSKLLSERKKTETSLENDYSFFIRFDLEGSRNGVLPAASKELQDGGEGGHSRSSQGRVFP